MLKLELAQTDKHSIKICSGEKISDFYVAQILIQNRQLQGLNEISNERKIYKNFK
jgi:hypothetical protein